MRELLPVVLAILAAGTNAPAQESQTINIGARRELFIDHFLIDKLDGARLTLHEPHPAEIAIKNDRPWEGAFNYGGIVINDGGTFRMYYRGWPAKGSPVRCCAESEDGIHWTKPAFGIHEVAGTKDNNVILVEAPFANNFSPFLDTRPGVPDDQRYKALAGHQNSGLFSFVSPDGVHWQKLGEKPVMTATLPNAFDSYCHAFWSESEGLYVCYFRCSVEGMRAVARTTSNDFVHWSEAVPMTFSDTGTTRPSQHLYENVTGAYYRAPHIYVAFPPRFVPGRRVVTDADLETLPMANLGAGDYFHDCSDAAFMTSRGGTHYDRTFMEVFVRPGPGPANWVSRTNYPIPGVVPTGPAEMSIYVNRHYAQESWHMRRYALRIDGFASVRAPYAGGEIVTKPLTFAGNALEINFATSAVGGIRVEIQEAGGKPVPGFALEDCPEILGDKIDRLVSWNRGSDVTALAGRPLRLRFVMKDADLYALRFR